MKTRKYIFLFSLLSILGVFVFQWINSSVSPSTSIFDALKRDAITVLTLEADMTQLLTKTASPNYQNAQLKVNNLDGTSDEYGVEVKMRGVNRKEVCDFPPLKLKFDQGELKNKNLSDYKTLKLVTHCKEGANFEQLILKEYLAYKLYNSITDKSFQVQLVKIKYVDTKSTQPAEEHYGFIIENKKQMADRLDADLEKKSEEPLKGVDAEQYRLFTLFQYMIGNTDWNLSKQHNIKMLSAGDTHGPIPVPYDFDYSGLVDAPYAKPYPTLPIDDVKERFFQFRGKKGTDLSPIFDLFKAKKRELISLCNDFDLLDEKVKREAINYLDSFYQLIEMSKDNTAEQLAKTNTPSERAA